MSKFLVSPEALARDWGFILTDEYNGLTGKAGRSVVEVVSAAKVPADWNGDKNIVAKALVQGKRGAQWSAYIYSNNFVSVIV